MPDLWFEEKLFPDPKSLEELDGGPGLFRMGPTNFNSVIRIHIPRYRILTDSEKAKLLVPKLDCKYILVRLGIELDPSPNGKLAQEKFDSALFQLFFQPIDNVNPRVYMLAPTELNDGKPESVKLKIEPSFSLLSGTSGSLGSIESDIQIGQVAPILRGFSGNNEMQPYWKLEGDPNAPLYGIRNFWLILEIPPEGRSCYLTCHAQGWLQTPYGKIFMHPARLQATNIPRYKFDFE